MTKKHFVRAAEIVHAILAGEWTVELPAWAPQRAGSPFYTNEDTYVRAVQTAEAFISLAQAFNPRFDTTRFLVACGLATKPAKPIKCAARRKGISCFPNCICTTKGQTS